MPQKNRKNWLNVLENKIKARAKTPKKKKPATTKKSAKRKTARKNNLWKWQLFKFVFVCGLIIFLLLAGYIFYCYVTMPNIQQALERTRQPSTIVMAQNGNEIAKFGNVYAQIIYPDKLPKNLTDAVIATEDRRFYKHFGFDIWGFSRAMLTNLFKKRYAQGASTITQQVAKNIFLTPQKNIRRKVQELLLAFWLENKLSKNQIMALYLNRVYFGSGNYGAEAASNWYFNKSVYDLNLREAAVLAGMLKAPNRYNPILQRENSLKRASTVLENMKKNNFISNKQYNQALQLPVSNGQKYRLAGGKYFAQYVYDEINNFIGERSDDLLVMTTLDQTLQETAEKILQQKISAARHKNVNQGAVVILDKTGAVKAMVGGVDYNRSQFNRAVQAKRQAGSAFKPFVYLTALQYGFTPDSIIHDGPVSIGKWHPENYTQKYYGDVTLSYALAHSLNAATVSLSKELYLKDIAANAYKMGITTDINLTPSMVLGTNNVKVIDMAAAYAVFANGGKAVYPYAINEIATVDGRQLYIRQQQPSTQIIDQSAIRQITIMLEQVINQGTGHNARLPIFAAGKTGTSQNYRDAWFIGWTNSYIAAVWVGNDNEKPMQQIGGGNLPAQIWHDIMITTIKGTPEENHNYSTYSEPVNDDGIAELIINSDKENSPQTIDDLLDNIE